ncbi:MAG: SprT family zinc-dependent metalloprotease [Bacteroides sp.]|nr:SprT family zinc-dependent metalloprotease [Bacteroides sp.]
MAFIFAVMRATLDFVNTVFDHYNVLCFGGRLPRLPIRLTDSLTHLGAFVHPKVWPASRPRGAGECHMRISRCLDRSEDELVDTIVHEMIHYYIWYTHTVDDGPHGRQFLALMNDINRRLGLTMSVRGLTTSETLDSDTRIKPHLICITHWRDGRRLITVCARKRLFEIHAAFTACPRVIAVEWWWSADPWFNRYGLSRTAKAMLISDTDYDKHVATATPCTCDGHKFQPITARQPSSKP